MHNSIIKDTIRLDKEAREKIEALKKEKDHLDELLKTETHELKATYEAENKKIIDERKESYQKEIETRQKREKDNYDKMLKEIQKLYKEQKEKWIEEIYEACIK
ncbi:hypothetical protein BK011_04030 [Tenericutes bacterium MZ-XQ]|jgi:dsDNA-binding SOS-regulon protein|nr:hypothetical protein BK011_04030 [Tenericutes bacterium MZ-XQ]